MSFIGESEETVWPLEPTELCGLSHVVLVRPEMNMEEGSGRASAERSLIPSELEKRERLVRSASGLLG